MSALASPTIDTWFQDAIEEEGMVEDHAYLWRRMIACVPEQDLRQFEILDYGCNRGGFLRMLYQMRPYRQALGVDVAQSSLATARELTTHIPVDFATPDALAQRAGVFDIAFSHEVLYLLPDLNKHAEAIARSLKRGGCYYAAIGCHTYNPLWEKWRTLIAQATNLPVYDYSLDDYAQAFWNAGMTVEMRPYRLDEFILIKPNNAYFPKAADSLNYHTNIKTIICARKGR